MRAALEAGPRTLLLLDNVEDASLLAPAERTRRLPWSRVVPVLVITRLAPGALADVECVALDVLPEREALRLLELEGLPDGERERAAALQIARRLGGHELALEVVAVYLWQSPEVSYDGYLARLEREGIAAVESARRDDLVRLSHHAGTRIGVPLEPTPASLSPAPPARLHRALIAARPRGPTFRSRLMRRLPATPTLGADQRRLLGLRLLTASDDPRFSGCTDWRSS